MNLKNACVLIVDDDIDVLTAFKLLLKSEVKEVILESNPERIAFILSKKVVDIICIDMNFGSSINNGNEGLFWLRKIKEWDNSLKVVLITAYGNIDLAVQAIKEGASDFIVKPWQNDRLIHTLREVLHHNKLHSLKFANETPSNELITQSEVMENISLKISKIAPTDANVLLLGENGTGKDVMAAAIHQQSLRANRPFIKVDLGSLSDTLFESELFGHIKGAFTDAREDRIGRFQEADGGTLFLDEIANISLHQQAKLLSVLQNRKFARLGSNNLININIRLICATNLPLRELADETRFRKDLIYRINTFEISLPPLRERSDDVVPLANYFLNNFSEKYQKSIYGFQKSAISKLSNYNFPGNIRELQNIVERAVIMTSNGIIDAADIIFSQLEQGVDTAIDAETKLSILEKNTILRVLDKSGGNISRSASELGITRAALYRKLNKYGI